jgi:uncharacterized membrane protein YfcA
MVRSGWATLLVSATQRVHLVLLKVLIGLLVGTLVGLTGLGGGVLLLPLLIFGLGVSPIIAVGSDALFNSFTKVGSGYLHWRQGSVNWYLVAALLTGSAPGAFAGVAMLAHLRAIYGNGVNDFIRVASGLLLVIIPTLLLVQGQLRAFTGQSKPTESRFRWEVVAIGLVAGFLVGMTSIGSGSVTMMLLMMMYPYAPLVMVGTDIVHAVALTSFTSFLHFRLGTIDPTLVACLLIGSIPGGLAGTWLSTYIPGHWLKRILCGVLFVTGVRMLMV